MRHPKAARHVQLDAWNKSYLGQLPPDIRDELLDDATTALIHRGNREEWVGRFIVLHRGLARIQALAEDGRAVTLRYAAAGQVVGLPSTVSTISPIPAEAMTDCTVTIFDVKKVNKLAKERPELANLLQRELTVILYEVIELLIQNVFSSVQSRVCKHLISLAIQSSEGLIVTADQNGIAESIGSVREVVAREIRKLRESGILIRRGGALIVVDPDRLAKLSQG